MKILMHYNDYAINKKRKLANGYGGVGYYRIVKVSEQIKNHDVKVIGQEFDHFGNSIVEKVTNIFKEHDVFWMPYFYQPETAGALFYLRDKFKKKVIIDLDDNFWDVPESNYLYDQFKKTKKDRAYLSIILSFADAVTVSTEPLRDKVRNHIKELHNIDKPVFVIPNCNDVTDWNHPIKPKSTDKIIIGYSGSTSHHDDLRMVVPAIVEVMKRHDNVWFEMIGLLGKSDIKDFFGGLPKKILDRMGIVGATDTFRQYPEMFSKREWDIGIAPLVDTAFTRSKSHIKWMEYSIYKIPTVASRVYPYFMELNGRQTIEDGVTGILAKPKEWAEKLERLVLDKTLRKTIGQNAYDFVKDHWQYKDSGISQVVNKMLS